VGLGFAAIGALLVALFTADLADPLAFCPRPPCSPGAACLIPACVPWTYPWIWVLAGLAVTILAFGLVVLSRAVPWARFRGWAVLLIGIAALPFAVLGLIFALPSSVPLAQALLVIGLGAIVIAAVMLGLNQNRLRALNGQS
jgi:hypothetical protein